MSRSVDIIQQIKKRFPPGREIHKTRMGTSYTVHKWDHSEKYGERTLYYNIPSKKRGKKPNIKSIPASVFPWTHKKLLQGKTVKKSDCLSDFDSVFGLDSCNFSALGGIFERLGYADHQPGKIISKCDNAS